MGGDRVLAGAECRVRRGARLGDARRVAVMTRWEEFGWLAAGVFLLFALWMLLLTLRDSVAPLG
jgi:hypothetical protein